MAPPTVQQLEGRLPCIVSQWSFVQNGMIVYQNLAWDGHLSPASYTVSTSSKAHKLIHSGDLHIWVRALMKDGTWSATGTVMVRIQGKGVPVVTPTPQHNVLYEADASNGKLDSWTGTSDWGHLNGMLTNDGSNTTNSWIMSPYQAQGTNDYAVEAEIQIAKPLGTTSSEANTGFGVQARNSSRGAYSARIWVDCCVTVHAQLTAYTRVSNSTDTLTDASFTPDTDWHTYRIEVQGNTIRFLLDGHPLLTAQDNRYLTGSGIGMWSSGVQITVRSVKVIAL